MDINKRSGETITYKRYFSIDLDPEDHIYFQSNKFMRDRSKVQEYLAERITFSYVGSFDPNEASEGQVEFDTGINAFSAVGTKINDRNEVVGTSSSRHDAFEVKDRKALVERLLGDLGIDVPKTFKAEVVS